MTRVRTGFRVDRRDDNGQVVPLTIAVLVFATACAAGVGHLGARAVRRAQARSAADAAALVAALPLEQAIAARRARLVAERNDAELVDVVRSGATTVVRVRVGDVVATAAARPAPRSDRSGTSGRVATPSSPGF